METVKIEITVTGKTLTNIIMNLLKQWDEAAMYERQEECEEAFDEGFDHGYDAGYADAVWENEEDDCNE